MPGRLRPDRRRTRGPAREHRRLVALATLGRSRSSTSTAPGASASATARGRSRMQRLSTSCTQHREEVKANDAKARWPAEDAAPRRAHAVAKDGSQFFVEGASTPLQGRQAVVRAGDLPRHHRAQARRDHEGRARLEIANHEMRSPLMAIQSRSTSGAGVAALPGFGGLGAWSTGAEQQPADARPGQRLPRHVEAGVRRRRPAARGADVGALSAPAKGRGGDRPAVRRRRSRRGTARRLDRERRRRLVPRRSSTIFFSNAVGAEADGALFGSARGWVERSFGVRHRGPESRRSSGQDFGKFEQAEGHRQGDTGLGLGDLEGDRREARRAHRLGPETGKGQDVSSSCPNGPSSESFARGASVVEASPGLVLSPRAFWARPKSDHSSGFQKTRRAASSASARASPPPELGEDLRAQKKGLRAAAAGPRRRTRSQARAVRASRRSRRRPAHWAGER